MDPKALKPGNYNLNHVYPFSMEGPALDGNQSFNNIGADLEFFKKSLVLTGDLKRVPILRSWWGDFYINPAWEGSMHGDFNSMMFWVDGYLNDVVDESDRWLFVEGELYIDEANGLIIKRHNRFSHSLGGGIVLPDKIHFDFHVLCEQTGTWGAGTLKFNLFLEVDWVEVTPDEFDDFIRENVYSRE